MLFTSMVLSSQYLREKQTFLGTARYWTEAFAMTSSLGVEEKVCSDIRSLSHRHTHKEMVLVPSYLGNQSSKFSHAIILLI